MNKLLSLTMLLGISVFMNLNTSFAVTLWNFEGDSVEMGSDYVSDVYYSLSDGVADMPNRANWDIAFRTNTMSSSIITNGGSGVILYTYPNADTSGWNSIDTNGLSTWTQMYNSLENWEEGAFMANAGTHPDYGWGKYNSTTHNITGDSFFIVQVVDMTYRKIWILKKESAKNIYHFRYAKLDGSDEQTVELNCNDYNTKDFIAFSLSGNQIVDREPLKASWDILFTKYVDKIYMGPTPTNYPVVGVLTNDKVYVARVSGQEETTYENYGSELFDSMSISVIGRDWKKTVGMPPSYVMVDSLLYFVSDVEGSVYRLYFTDFVSGSTGNGKVVFNTKKLGGSSVYNDEGRKVSELVVYPNPSKSRWVNLLYFSRENSEISIDILDMMGKVVFKTSQNAIKGLNTLSISSADLSSGNYIVKVSDGFSVLTSQIIISQ